MHIPLSEFLQTYKDQDIYMVQDLVPEMTGDFFSFLVFLFFSCQCISKERTLPNG